MAKFIALLVTGWTLLGLSKGLRCYCNSTASILVDCITERSCETDYMCVARRLYSDSEERYITIWGCLTLELNDIRIRYQSLDSCNGDIDTNRTTYKCCSDSVYCNRHLDVTVPDEVQTSDEEPTSGPTATPSATPSVVVTSPSPDANRRLKCHCNSTAGPTPPDCIANDFTCETDFACITQRYSNELGRVGTSWYCADQLGQVLQDAICVVNNSRNVVRCCNSSDYCNRGITLRLPSEQLPRTDPTTTGTTEFVVPVNRPVVAPESQLFVWLTVTVIGVAVFVAAVVLAVCVGILARYYHVQRKVTLSHHEFNTVPCKTAA